MERTKNTDKDRLKKAIFWLCGKAIAEPKRHWFTLSDREKGGDGEDVCRERGIELDVES